MIRGNAIIFYEIILRSRITEAEMTVAVFDDHSWAHDWAKTHGDYVERDYYYLKDSYSNVSITIKEKEHSADLWQKFLDENPELKGRPLIDQYHKYLNR